MRGLSLPCLVLLWLSGACGPIRGPDVNGPALPADGGDGGASSSAALPLDGGAPVCRPCSQKTPVAGQVCVAAACLCSGSECCCQ